MRVGPRPRIRDFFERFFSWLTRMASRHRRNSTAVERDPPPAALSGAASSPDPSTSQPIAPSEDETAAAEDASDPRETKTTGRRGRASPTSAVEASSPTALEKAVHRGSSVAAPFGDPESSAAVDNPPDEVDRTAGIEEAKLEKVDQRPSEAGQVVGAAATQHEHEPSPEHNGTRVSRGSHKRRSGVAPVHRGGRPRGTSSTTDTERTRSTRAQKRLRPELVCWREGMTWSVGVEVPEDLVDAKISVFQGSAVDEDPDEPLRRRLKRPLGQVEIRWCFGDEDDPTVRQFPAEEFRIFKLTGDADRGRRMDRVTRGRFLVVVPDDWARDEGTSGQEFIVAEPAPGGNWAHHFEIDGKEVVTAAFVKPDGTRLRVPSAASGLTLVGDPVPYVVPDAGPLFIKDLPGLSGSYASAVVGEEGPGDGRRRWRASARSFDEVVPEIQKRGAGWFFVRAYDDDAKLLDSFDFRYASHLNSIRIETGVPLPGPDGHRTATIRFSHETQCSVRAQPPDGRLRVEAREQETWAIVPAHPDCDISQWQVETADRSVSFGLIVERVWWAFSDEETEPEPTWIDRPAKLDKGDFAPTSPRTIVVRLPKNGWASDLRIGFLEHAAYRIPVSPRKYVHSLALRNLGGREALERAAGSVPLKLWIKPKDRSLPVSEAELASVTCPASSSVLQLEVLDPKRLMSLFSRLRRELRGPARVLIKELRREYYCPARRGDMKRQSACLRQGLALLAVLLELAATTGVVTRLAPARWKRRARIARAQFPAEYETWESRLQGSYRGKAVRESSLVEQR